MPDELDSHGSSEVVESKGDIFEHTEPAVDEEVEANQGYILDASLYANSNVKTTADGRIVLIPQPSDHPEDPLNWPRAKKLTVLIVISTISFLPEYGSAMGIPALIPQSMQWHLPPNTVQHNLVAQLVTIGGGAVFTIAVSNYFGRLPILLVWQTIAVGAGIWNAAATTFSSYLASRAICGFFSVVAAGGGLMWIKDMFFFHEHPRMINIWSGGVIVAPYLSPLTEAFITWKSKWPWGFLVYSILNVVGWFMIIFWADETWYARSPSGASQPPVKKSRVKRLLGIEQWSYMRQNGATFTRAFARPLIAISKVPVFLTVTFYFINFAWVIGVNATTAVWMTAYYHFNGKDLGLFYLAGILGSIIGEVLGHWMHDAVGNFFLRRHGRLDPEVRLYISYLASVLMAVALLVLGFALENAWHYMVVAVFYGVQVAGIMIATTAVNAYVLDAYPEGSGEVGAWICFGRVFGGFMATYINIPWVQKTGPSKVFAIQAGITIGAALIILVLQLFGKRLRKAQGKMVF